MGSHRVLIVEDDPAVAEVLTAALTGEGYAVTSAGSGLGAAALARRLRPRVILLDLGLPYRSGASVLTELKADQRTEHIPVIVVSSMPDALTPNRRALAAGVIEKPFDVQALLEQVRAVQKPGHAA